MNRKSVFIFFTLWLCIFADSLAQTEADIFKAAGTPPHPKVDVSWNRYYSYNGITAICQKIANAYPQLAKLESIGKSYQNREIRVLTITNFDKGKPDEKPAFYIDGNIHSNEIQGAEIALYTAWYLTECFAQNDFIRQLLNDKVFYILPTINPDAREHFLKQPNTAHSPRAGVVPLDDDGDGRIDEDKFDDLNNDGHITMMRRKNPNGRFVQDNDDPRYMVRVAPDKNGEYEMLGYEGLDNDGDGRVNEDRTGNYDPNRDWGWNWQPGYVQRGALKYPFSLPETRAVADFIMAHQNIAGAQTYHNFGGMILRGPGTNDANYIITKKDKMVYDNIGKRGQKMLPGYRYMVLYKDLYEVYGGEIDWLYGGRGIYTFTNELYTGYLMFHKKNNNFWGNRKEQYEFDKYMLFNDAFVEWEEYEHPQHGLIEIGGFKKNYLRAHPGFLLEADAHRNMAFTLYHAYHTPKLEITGIEEQKLGGGLFQITVTVANKRLTPTHSGQDLKYNITRPDYISIEGADVLVGMRVKNKDMNITVEQKHEPEKIKVANIEGLGTVTVRWIVKGKRKYNVIVDSEKGGKIISTK